MLFDRFIRFPIKNTSAYAGEETYAEFGRKSLLILSGSSSKLDFKNYFLD